MCPSGRSSVGRRRGFEAHVPDVDRRERPRRALACRRTSPAMTRTVPGAVGQVDRRDVGVEDAPGSRAGASCASPAGSPRAASCRNGRRVCVKSARGYSSWRMPPPAVIHCTSPGPMMPPWPASRGARPRRHRRWSRSRSRDADAGRRRAGASAGANIVRAGIVEQQERADMLARAVVGKERADGEAVAHPMPAVIAVTSEELSS